MSKAEMETVVPSLRVIEAMEAPAALAATLETVCFEGRDLFWAAKRDFDSPSSFLATLIRRPSGPRTMSLASALARKASLVMPSGASRR